MKVIKIRTIPDSSTFDNRHAGGLHAVILKINGGYHGVAPWMQEPESGGTVDEDFVNIISIDWNSVSQLEQAITFEILIFVCVGIWVVFLVSSNLTRPFKNIIQVLQNIKKGELR